MHAYIQFSGFTRKEVRPVLVIVFYWFGGVAGTVCFGWFGFLRLGVQGFFGQDFFSGFGGVV